MSTRPRTNHTAIHSWPIYSTATAVIGICLNCNCISIYINQKWALAQCLHFVGPMFTFYISLKMHKNLLSPPNHLYHHSFQIRAGPDFLTPPFLDNPVKLPRPQSCYFLMRDFTATKLPPLTSIC